MAIGRGNCTDEQRWVGSRGLAGFLWRTNDTELREKRRKKVVWDTNSEELWISVSLTYFSLLCWTVFGTVYLLSVTAMRSYISRSCRLVQASRFLSTPGGGKADFGFKDVNAGEKERLVREVFSSVASKYDVMNDLMSMGVHRVWKDEFVNMIGYSAAAKTDPNYLPRHLDVAGGTGDIAFRSANTMSKVFRPLLSEKMRTEEFNSELDRPIIVCDINPEMLAVGKSRAASQVGHDNTKLVRSLSVLMFM